jgi:hypothetical protein
MLSSWSAGVIFENRNDTGTPKSRTPVSGISQEPQRQMESIQPAGSSGILQQHGCFYTFFASGIRIFAASLDGFA